MDREVVPAHSDYAHTGTLPPVPKHSAQGLLLLKKHELPVLVTGQTVNVKYAFMGQTILKVVVLRLQLLLCMVLG